MAEPKKKVPGLAGILIGIGKKKPADEEETGESEADDMGEASDGEAAMQALRDALDSGDMAAAWSAFEDAARLCQSYDDE